MIYFTSDLHFGHKKGELWKNIQKKVFLKY